MLLERVIKESGQSEVLDMARLTDKIPEEAERIISGIKKPSGSVGETG